MAAPGANAAREILAEAGNPIHTESLLEALKAAIECGELVLEQDGREATADAARAVVAGERVGDVAHRRWTGGEA